MVLNQLKAGLDVDDLEFDNALYPESMHDHSTFHFTPIEISIKAAQYLVDEPGTKVLDIGSGAGKFCLVGAACTEGHFTGVEHRWGLHQAAIQVMNKKQLSNIEFIHANIITIDFRQYQAFYFYNSFFENIFPGDKIDDTVLVQKELYKAYSTYVKGQLDAMPTGTRLVTYYSSYHEVPESYKAITKIEEQKLTMWEKKS